MPKRIYHRSYFQSKCLKHFKMLSRDLFNTFGFPVFSHNIAENPFCLYFLISWVSCVTPE